MNRPMIRTLVWGFVACSAWGCAENSAPAPKEPQAPAAPASAVAVERKPVPPDILRQRLELAIDHVRSRELQTTNAFWTVFHGMLGLGPNVELVDPNSGTRVPALAYIFGGDYRLGAIRGARFVPTADGLDVTIGPVHVGQGHQDQFVAEITQWGVPKDTPVVVFGKQYTMMDFVKESMARARVGQELSWTTIIVAQFVGTDAKWTNRMGENLTFEDLLKSECDASVENAACGGTHRLFGMTWCYFIHLRSGGDVSQGVWKEVKEKLDRYVEIAKQNQNPDGSFSSAYFKEPGQTADLQDMIGSSGHILEWLATYLPDEELKAPWVQDAAMAVSQMILDAKAMPLESGALYHATHGLVTYHKRVYKSEEPEEKSEDNVGLAPMP